VGAGLAVDAILVTLHGVIMAGGAVSLAGVGGVGKFDSAGVTVRAGEESVDTGIKGFLLDGIVAVEAGGCLRRENFEGEAGTGQCKG
jgi:hypothetical protein